LIFHAFVGEVRKDLLLLWSYRFSTLFDVFGYSTLYVAAMFFIGRGEFQQSEMESTLVGFLATFFILETLSHMSFEIMFEAQTGTFEQMYMSAVSPIWVITARVVSVHIKSLMSVAMMGAVLALVFHMNFVFFNPLGLLILGIILVGVLGFGFLIAGMTIVYKQVESFSSVLSNLILFLNGTFLPIDVMPGWLQAIVQIIPTTRGIVVMRRVVLEDALLDTIADGSLLILIVHSTAFLLAGLALFQICIHYARQKGTLGHY
jgi:ABC-2 type transport system permease protein